MRLFRSRCLCSLLRAFADFSLTYLLICSPWDVCARSLELHFRHWEETFIADVYCSSGCGFWFFGSQADLFSHLHSSLSFSLHFSPSSPLFSGFFHASRQTTISSHTGAQRVSQHSRPLTHHLSSSSSLSHFPLFLLPQSLWWRCTRPLTPLTPTHTLFERMWNKPRPLSPIQTAKSPHSTHPFSFCQTYRGRPEISTWSSRPWRAEFAENLPTNHRSATAFGCSS